MTDVVERRLRGRPRSAQRGDDGGAVQSVDRAVALLRLIAASDGLSLSELARLGDVAPSTAYRMVTTLQQSGLVEFEDTSQLWFVGVEAFRIGSAFLRRRKLAERGRPIIQQLMLQTGETANIALAERESVVFVTQAETHEPIRAFFRPGTRSPYHASGIGKAVLAFMPAAQREEFIQSLPLPSFTAQTLSSLAALTADLEVIRGRGFALDDQERHIGMRCIAAPVFDESSSPLGGLSVSGPTVRIDQAFIERTAPAVVAAAAGLTRLVGGTPPR